ncbi:MAG: hypothetical protein WCK80_00130 [bacterium]
MQRRIKNTELIQAQATLFIAIALQVAAARISNTLLPQAHYTIIAVEVFLAAVLGLLATSRKSQARALDHNVSVVFLAILTVANIIALSAVLKALIVENKITDGKQLLASAVVIFFTNIIVFCLWYWEIDSPGLSGKRWSKHDKDFQFTQQDMKSEFPNWSPEFGDYLYLSVTNALNFAPADCRPITRQAKYLMAAQSVVSVFTLALVIARSVSILGA